MLFDEPTSALGHDRAGDVLDDMKGLAVTSITMIVVTHEIGFARQVADRVIFTDGCEIVETVTPEEIFTSLREARSQNLLSADLIH